MSVRGRHAVAAGGSESRLYYICREAVGSHQCTRRGTESLELSCSSPRREVCARARVERRAARTFSIQTAVCLRRSHSFVPLLSCYLNSDFGLLIITDAHM